MHPLIELYRDEILALADHHGIRNVRVFGFMVCGEADEKSDVDLLVTLPPDNPLRNSLKSKRKSA